MTRSTLEQYLILSGWTQRSKSVWRHGLMEIKFLDMDGVRHWFSIYDSKRDSEIGWEVEDVEESLNCFSEDLGIHAKNVNLSMEIPIDEPPDEIFK